MTDSTDRRHATRHFTCLPIGVATPAAGRYALIKDASVSGGLLLLQARPAVGDTLTLNVRPDDGKSVQVEAVVVRMQPLDEGIWTSEVAVRFEPVRPDLESYFAKLESSTKARGL